MSSSLVEVVVVMSALSMAMDSETICNGDAIVCTMGGHVVCGDCCNMYEGWKDEKKKRTR